MHSDDPLDLSLTRVFWITLRRDLMLAYYPRPPRVLSGLRRYWQLYCQWIVYSGLTLMMARWSRCC